MGLNGAPLYSERLCRCAIGTNLGRAPPRSMWSVGSTREFGSCFTTPLTLTTAAVQSRSS